MSFVSAPRREKAEKEEEGLPRFWAAEPLSDSQSGTQTPPKRVVVVAGGVKYHLRDKYSTTTRSRTTKPTQAPRNAVVSTVTRVVGRQKKTDTIAFVRLTQLRSASNLHCFFIILFQRYLSCHEY